MVALGVLDEKSVDQNSFKKVVIIFTVPGKQARENQGRGGIIQ